MSKSLSVQEVKDLVGQLRDQGKVQDPTDLELNVVLEDAADALEALVEDLGLVHGYLNALYQDLSKFYGGAE